ncbi:arrestin domain-containing protein 17-like [Copidosoma floridanum]|uniref:arrestin domain-containing protein 17-like n=1 Tax=Copidosoma floridanum TaxID=29053 RepID=UPI000C6FB56A|nr:arrestin domain-containing protein 17-like [Copidosoma floridanum]
MAPATGPDPASYGLERIDVVLDNANGVFVAGKTVTGCVRLRLRAPIDALGICVRCKGEARVRFTDRSAGIRRKFAAEEGYLHLEPYIFGDGESSSRVEVTGSCDYSFSLELPDKVPCSFEGLYGRIRYSIRASLVVARDVVFHSQVLPFSLVSTVDLNRDSLAPLPISESQTKRFIGQREPLWMELSLPVRGFVPGQTVPLLISLKNESNVRVAKIRIVLKKVATYHVKEVSKSRRHKEIVVEIELPVEGREQTIREYLDMPSVPPSGANYCGIIDVRYALKVEACVDLGEWYYRMLQKNPKIRTEIVIGTVPLDNYEDPLGRPTSGSTREYIHTHTPSEERLYERSQTYRSSKPDRDDPTGDEGDSDGEIHPYSPMYRVYKFDKTSKNS